MKLINLVIPLSILINIYILYILFNQIKKILNNQEAIKLELNKIIVAIKYKDN